MTREELENIAIQLEEQDGSSFKLLKETDYSEHIKDQIHGILHERMDERLSKVDPDIFPDDLFKKKKCNCICHKKGTIVRHIRPCCDNDGYKL